MALKAFGLLRQGLIGLKKRKMGPERPVSPELSRKSLFFRREKAIDPEGLTARKQEWDRGLWPDVFLRALRASQGKICHFESSGAGNACKKGLDVASWAQCMPERENCGWNTRIGFPSHP
jgi:hypothetical protein